MIYRSRFPNFITRTEIKLRLKPSEAEALREEVERHLPPYCYVPDRPVTFVSSVYFDTDDLHFYRRAKRFPHDNLKVRLKEYYYRVDGTNEVSEYCWIELKRRLAEATSKLRFQTPKQLVSRLFEGEDLFDVIRACNRDLTESDLSKIYEDFLDIVRRFRLRPQSVTNYRRRTYQQREDESIRITFDDMIAYFRPPPFLFNGTRALVREVLGEPAGRQYHTVVEIKMARRTPQWLRELLARYPQSNFSKFLTSTQTVLPLLGRRERVEEDRLGNRVPEEPPFVQDPRDPDGEGAHAAS